MDGGWIASRLCVSLHQGGGGASGVGVWSNIRISKRVNEICLELTLLLQILLLILHLHLPRMRVIVYNISPCPFAVL